MGRRPTEKICCVCLNVGLDFDKLTKKDNNKMSLLTKFRMCIMEVLWLPSFYLCSVCLKTLNIVHTFREQCLKSDIIRKEQSVKKEQLWVEPLIEPVVDNEHSINAPDIDISLDNVDDATVNVKPEIELLIENSYDGDSGDIEDKNESENDTKLDTEELEDSNSDKRPRKKRNRLFICQKCDKHWHTSTKLIAHCVKEHEMERKEVKPFSCDRCPQRFSSSSNLWQHMKYHEGVKSNMCTYCGKGFITKTDLMNHEKKHLNMREYNCEFCGKSFNTHKDIRSHRLIVHTDTSLWKFICEICTKPFPIKSNFDSHMRRHMGEKKFSCHLCDKKFTTKCDLQRHTRSHSDVREHQCHHCDKEYKDERVLKVHMAKVHSIGLGKVKIPVRKRNFICHFCPKAYYAKNKLTRHLYTHSGEKPFSCPICNKKFNDKSYVKQHLRNTHNIEDQEPAEKPPKMSYLLMPGNGPPQ